MVTPEELRVAGRGFDIAGRQIAALRSKLEFEEERGRGNGERAQRLRASIAELEAQYQSQAQTFEQASGKTVDEALAAAPKRQRTDLKNRDRYTYTDSSGNQVYLPPNQVNAGLRSGVYTGARGEQVVVQQGVAANKAGGLIRKLQGGPYQPTVGNQAALKEKVVGVRKGNNLFLGPNRLLVTDGETKKVINELPQASVQDGSIRSGVYRGDDTRSLSLLSNGDSNVVRDVSTPQVGRPKSRLEAAPNQRLIGFVPTSSELDYRRQKAVGKNPFKEAGYFVAGATVGFAETITRDVKGVGRFFKHPIKTTKAVGSGVWTAVTNPQQTIANIGNEARINPSGFTGSIAARYAEGKVIGAALQRTPVGKGSVEVKTGEGTTSATTVGVEAKTTAVPFFTKVTRPLKVFSRGLKKRYELVGEEQKPVAVVDVKVAKDTRPPIAKIDVRYVPNDVQKPLFTITVPKSTGSKFLTITRTPSPPQKPLATIDLTLLGDTRKPFKFIVPKEQGSPFFTIARRPSPPQKPLATIDVTVVPDLRPSLATVNLNVVKNNPQPSLFTVDTKFVPDRRPLVARYDLTIKGVREVPYTAIDIKAPTEFYFGPPSIKNKINPKFFSEQVPAPEGAVTGVVFRRLIDFSPQEQLRISSSVRATSLLQTERGLPVKQAFFNLEVKNPKAVTKELESFAKQEGGVFFGSATTQQLPSGFKNVKIGDVDLLFPKRTVEYLKPKVAQRAKRLRQLGEDADVSKENPLIIENTKTRAKILEVKSGVDQATLGEELAPAGFYGIKFPDIKAGHSPSTVPFGEARAIKAGEQFARKGAAVNIVRPASPAAVPGLQEAGVLGKAQRSAKDIAGFIQSGRGIIAIREAQNPITRFFKGPATKRAAKELTTFEESFSPGQRRAIDTKLAEMLGNERKVRLLTSDDVPDLKSPELSQTTSRTAVVSTELAIVSPSFEPSKVSEPSLPVKLSPRLVSPSPRSSVSRLSSASIQLGSVSSRVSPSRSPSPSRSVSPSPSPSVSTSLSRSGFSRSPSPSISTSPSASPSPSRSVSKSPSPSPSPSPSVVKSPYLSRFRNASKTSKIPSPSPSPRISRGGFDVFVRRFGKFSQVNKKPLKVEEAFMTGKNVVKGSAAASFKVTKLGQPVIDVPKSLLPSKEFRPSKREPGVFVQQPKFRISSAGELADITLKGISASRRKRR